MPDPIRWIPVPGGVRDRPGRHGADRQRIPDLLWSQDLLTLRQLDRPGGSLPVTGLTLEEASRLAATLGARLPTADEWEWMAAGGPANHRYPWGDQPWRLGLGNLRPAGIGAPTPVGWYRAGATPTGLLDVAGNLWELTTTPTTDRGVIVKGGSYNSLVRYAECGFRNAIPPSLRSPGIGLRLVRDP